MPLSPLGVNATVVGVDAYLANLNRMAAATSAAANQIAASGAQVSNFGNDALASLEGVITRAAMIGTVIGSTLEKALGGILGTITGFFNNIIGTIKVGIREAGMVDEMSIAVTQMGTRMGLTAREVDKYVQSVKMAGIETEAAQRAVLNFMRNEWPLAAAKPLVAIAQGASISTPGTTSTEVFERMMHGIMTMQPEVLRMVNINVSAVDSLKAYNEVMSGSAKWLDDVAKKAGMTAEEFKKELGVVSDSSKAHTKNIDALNQHERQLATLFGTLKNGVPLIDLYTAAMESPEKKMASMKRVVNEITILLGQPFQSAFGSYVDTIWKGAERLQQALTPNKEQLKSLAENITKTAADAVSAARKAAWDTSGDIAFGPKPGAGNVAGPATPAAQAQQNLKNKIDETNKALDQQKGAMERVTMVTDEMNLTMTATGAATDAATAKTQGLKLASGELFNVFVQIGAVSGLVVEGVKTISAKALPLVLDAFASIHGQVTEWISEAADWGFNVVEQFAFGLIEAASTVLSTAMDIIGNILTFFLAPGSPPRVAPDLDVWGKKAGQVYFDSFTDADFKDPAKQINRELAAGLSGTQEIGAVSFPDQQGEATGWGSGMMKALAGGINKNMTDIGMSMMNLGGEIAAWLTPHSPPKVAPDIDKWGKESAEVYLTAFGAADVTPVMGLMDRVGQALMAGVQTVTGAVQAMTNRALVSVKGWSIDFMQSLLGGFSSADFDMLGVFEGQVSKIVSLFSDYKWIPKEDTGAFINNIKQEMMLTIDEFNKFGTVSGSIFDMMDQKMAGYAGPLKELLKRQFALAHATKQAEQAARTYANAQARAAGISSKLSTLTAQYNKMLAGGASKAALQNKLKEINLTRKQAQNAAKEVARSKTAAEAAQAKLDPLREQVALQQKILDQMLEMAKAEVEAQKEREKADKANKDKAKKAADDWQSKLGAAGTDKPVKSGMQIAVEELQKALKEKLAKAWEKFKADFAKSPAGAAWEKLKKSWENFSAIITKFWEQRIKPVFDAIANDKRVKGFIEALANALGKLAGTAAVVGAGMLVLKVVFAIIAAAVGLLIKPIVLIALGISTLLVAWQQNWFGIRDTVVKAVSDIGAWFGKLIDAFSKGGLSGVLAFLGDEFKKLWENIKNGAKWLKDRIPEAFEAIKERVGAIWDNITSKLTGKWREVADGAERIWGNITKTITEAWGGVSGQVSATWRNISNTFSATGTSLIEIGAGIVGNLRKVFSGQLSINDLLSGIDLEKFQQVGADFAKNLGDGLTAGWTWLRNAISGIVANIGNWFRERLSGVSLQTVEEWGRNLAASISGFFASKFTSVISNGTGDLGQTVAAKISDSFRNIDWGGVAETGLNIIKAIAKGVIGSGAVLFSFFKGFFGQLFANIEINLDADRFREMGDNLIGGLSQGITQGAANLWGTIKSLAGRVIDFFKELFGIASPSRFMADIGLNLILGLVQGLSSGQGGIMQAVTTIVNNFFSSLFSRLTPKSAGTSGKNAMFGLTSWITGEITRLINAVDWGRMFSNGTSIVSSLLTGNGNAREAVGTLFENVKMAIRNVADAISADPLIASGREVMGGFFQGLLEKAQGLPALVTRLFTDFIGWVKGILGIASPSTVFINIASAIIQGLSLGLTGSAGGLWMAVSKIASGIIDTFWKGMSGLGNIFIKLFSSTGSTAASAATTMASSITRAVIDTTGKDMADYQQGLKGLYKQWTATFMDGDFKKSKWTTVPEEGKKAWGELTLASRNANKGIVDLNLATQMGLNDLVKNTQAAAQAAATTGATATSATKKVGDAAASAAGAVTKAGDKAADAAVKFKDMSKSLPSDRKGGFFAFLKNVGSGIFKLVGNVKTIGGAIVRFLGPIGLVITAVGAFFLAWKNNLFGLRDLLKPVEDAVRGFAGKIIEFFTGGSGAGGAAVSLKTRFDNLGTGIREFVDNARSKIEGFVGPIVDAFKEKGIGGALDVLKDKWSKATGPIGEFVASIGDKLGDFFKKVRGWFSDDDKDGIPNIIETLRDKWQTVWGDIERWWNEHGEPTFQKIKDKAGEIKDALKEVPKFIQNVGVRMGILRDEDDPNKRVNNRAAGPDPNLLRRLQEFTMFSPAAEAVARVVSQVMHAFDQLGRSLVPVGQALGRLWDSFMASRIPLIIAGAIGLAFEAILAIVERLGPFLVTTFDAVGLVLRDVGKIIDDIVGSFVSIYNMVAKGDFSGFGDAISKLAQDLLGLILDINAGVNQILYQAATAILQWFANIARSLGMEDVAKFFENAIVLVEQYIALIGEKTQKVKEAFQEVFYFVSGFISSVFSGVWDIAKALWRIISNVAQALWALVTGQTDKVGGFFKEALNGVGDFLRSALSLVLNILANIGGAVGAAIANVWDEFVATAGGATKAWLEQMGLTNLGQTIREVIADWRTIGTQIIGGLVTGIEEAWQYLVHVVTSWFYLIVAKVKEVLGIASPSQVFADIGVNLIQGLINGIGSMVQAVWGFVVSIVQGIIGFFTDPNALISIVNGGIQWLTSLWNGFAAAFPQVAAFVTGLVESILNVFTGDGPIGRLLQAGAGFIMALWNGINGVLTSLWNIVTAAVQLVLSGFTDPAALQTLLEAGRSFLVSIINGVLGVVQALWGVIQTVVQSVIGIFTNNETIGKFLKAGWDWIVQTVTGIWTSIQQSVQTIINAARSILTVFTDPQLLLDFATAGWNMIVGLVKGLTDSLTNAWETVKGLGQKVFDGITGIFDLGSPSKTMITAGTDITTGLKIGLENGAQAAIDQAQATGLAVSGAFDTTLDEDAAKQKAQSVISALTQAVTALPNLTEQLNAAIEAGNVQAAQSITERMQGVAQQINGTVEAGLKAQAAMPPEIAREMGEAMATTLNNVAHFSQSAKEGFGDPAYWTQVGATGGQALSTAFGQILDTVTQTATTGVDKVNATTVAMMQAGMQPLPEIANTYMDQFTGNLAAKTEAMTPQYQSLGKAVPDNFMTGLNLGLPELSSGAFDLGTLTGTEVGKGMQKAAPLTLDIFDKFGTESGTNYMAGFEGMFGSSTTQKKLTDTGKSTATGLTKGMSNEIERGQAKTTAQDAATTLRGYIENGTESKELEFWRIGGDNVIDALLNGVKRFMEDTKAQQRVQIVIDKLRDYLFGDKDTDYWPKQGDEITNRVLVGVERYIANSTVARISAVITKLSAYIKDEAGKFEVWLGTGDVIVDKIVSGIYRFAFENKDIAGRILEIANKIKSYFFPTPDIWKPAGEGILEGIVIGMQDKIHGGSVDWRIRDVVNALLNKVREAAGEHSPAKVFMPVGANMTAGVAVGMEQITPEAARSIGRAVRNVTGSFSDKLNIATASLPNPMQVMMNNMENGTIKATVAVDGLTDSVFGLGMTLRAVPSRMPLSIQQRVTTEQQRMVSGYSAQYQHQRALGMVRAQPVSGQPVGGAVYNSFVFNTEVRDPMDTAFLQARIERAIANAL